MAHNLHRRHMTESQRSMVAAKLAKISTNEFRGNQHTANLQEAPTRAEAADLLNVSERSVNTAKKVERQGVPELVEAVERGDNQHAQNCAPSRARGLGFLFPNHTTRRGRECSKIGDFNNLGVTMANGRQRGLCAERPHPTRPSVGLMNSPADAERPIPYDRILAL